MDEATYVLVFTSLVQTVVITLTLLVFIFQFRSQERAIRESSYQNLMGRYNEFMMLQAEKPELNKLLRDQLLRHDTNEDNPEERSAFVSLLIAYGIIEETFLLYAKNWIDEETWEQWAEWLKALAKHPRFDLIHRRMKGQFDKYFQDYVTRILEQK